MNDATPQAVYTLDILAEITGVSTQTIVEYQEHGLIHPELDDESLRALRRIEHLRESCQVNLAGLKMLTSLLEEVEQLREELRMLQK
jgi:DNA-binding transcriptional MerR regulator